jgi:hypothetical protein
VPSRSRRRLGPVSIPILLAALLVLVGSATEVSAAPFPTLPLADDRGFVGNLSAPYLTPGASGIVSFTVGNPLPHPMTTAQLTFQVYAFNGFPGNATQTVSVAGAPVLSNASSSGGSVGVTVGTLPSGGLFRGSVSVATSATTPSGDFAVRVALQFAANGSDYLLESRGWFNASVWAAATELPNGSATLNLTVLGVSGVLPETAIEVQPSSFPLVLAGVLAVAVVLIGVGAWVYFRSGSGSSSGTRSADDDHHAPSAFGKRRTRDGD